MLNAILSVVALIVLILGVISLVSPIPGGLLVIAFSVTTLICVNAKAQACVLYFRSKYEFVNKIFTFLQNKIGSRIHFIGDALRRTEPKDKSIS